jgi:hypothetical protein
LSAVFQDDETIILEENYDPRVILTPDDRVRVWLTPAVVFGLATSLVCAYATGGGARTEHVWTVVGPLLVFVLQRYYSNEHNKNKSVRRRKG